MEIVANLPACGIPANTARRPESCVTVVNVESLPCWTGTDSLIEVVAAVLLHQQQQQLSFLQ